MGFRVALGQGDGGGPLLLHDLRMAFGLEAVVSAKRTIPSNYWQSNLSTEDFQVVLEKVTGEDFDTYFEQYVYGNEVLPVRPFVAPEDADTPS